MNRKPLGCPFCGATPQQYLTKAHIASDGEPIQRVGFRCPKRHAQVTGWTRELALAEWETRAPLIVLGKGGTQ